MTKVRIGSMMLLCCALFCASTIVAFATDYYWNVASGDWSVGANWDPAGPPTNDGTNVAQVFFENGGTADIDTDVTSTDVGLIRLNNGTINQNASYDVSVNYLVMGMDGDGTYNISGGSLEARHLYLGHASNSMPAGRGYFNMSGGVAQTLDCYIGQTTGSHAEFSISGGTFDVENNMYIGYATDEGDAILNQTGGAVNVGFRLYIGDTGSMFDPRDGFGIYNMSGGTLDVAYDIYVGSQDGRNGGALNFTGGTISAINLYIKDHAWIDDSGAAPGAGGTIRIWGDLINSAWPTANFDMRHTTVMMSGGTGFEAATHEWNCDVLDMNSSDFGATVTGIDDNFALGTLVFRGSTANSLWYRLESDIYCYGLVIEEGAGIDLNGYNIYYLAAGTYSGISANSLVLDGQWFNLNGGDGDVIAIAPVPEPATIMLIGSGLLALAGLARKRLA